MAKPRLELNERERSLQQELEHYLQEQWLAIGDAEKQSLGLHETGRKQRVLWAWATQFIAKKLEPLELALEEVRTLRQFTFSTPTNRTAVDAVADMAEAIVPTLQRAKGTRTEDNGVSPRGQAKDGAT